MNKTLTTVVANLPPAIALVAVTSMGKLGGFLKEALIALVIWYAIQIPLRLVFPTVKYHHFELLDWLERTQSRSPALIISLLIGGFFYKFGRFDKEFVAFLATWAVISWIFSQFTSRTQRTA